MKKVFLSFLTLLLFTGYGMAQSSNLEGMKTSKGAKTSSKQVTSNKAEISAEELAYMNTLKRTDVDAYIVYLEERKEIALMKNQLENQKEMDSAKKAELTIKLNELKAKHSF